MAKEAFRRAAPDLPHRQQAASLEQDSRWPGEFAALSAGQVHVLSLE
jgi:hypothetical protein